jgi:hypothetical protein
LNSAKNRKEINQNKTRNYYISQFLKQVKRKLPFWLKGQPKEFQSILSDIENHILDKAHELAGNTVPSVEIIKDTITNHMKSPEEFALPFKKQGTPKFYITEELSRLFLKTVFTSAIIIFTFTLILTIFSSKTQSANDSFQTFLVAFFLGCGLIFIIISVIFAYLSMQGFIPESNVSASNKIINTESLKAKSNEIIDHKYYYKFISPKYIYFNRMRLLIVGIVGILIGIIVFIIPRYFLSFAPGTKIPREEVNIIDIYMFTRILCTIVGFVLITANILRFLQSLVGFRKILQIMLFFFHAIWIGVSILAVAPILNEIIILKPSDFISSDRFFPWFEDNVLILYYIAMISIILLDIIRGVLIAIKGFPNEQPNKSPIPNISRKS